MDTAFVGGFSNSFSESPPRWRDVAGPSGGVVADREIGPPGQPWPIPWAPDGAAVREPR